MNNHQLTLIADEPDQPQPVWTNSAIKQMLNELAETRRQRNELAEQLTEAQAEINRLTNAGLECAYGETMAVDETEDWVKLAFAHEARIADLTGKLNAANLELHQLRIKTKWQPVAINEDMRCDCGLCDSQIWMRDQWGLVIASATGEQSIQIPDSVRLCRQK